jgi:16S rRNA (uracil1498-N3)-methyltransferase
MSPANSPMIPAATRQFSVIRVVAGRARFFFRPPVKEAMPRYDFRTPRLFLEEAIELGRKIELSRAQTNYLLNVLRLGDRSPVLVFNGRDGEWRASLRSGRKTAALEVEEQTRPQTAAGDLEYLFAPIKHARIDYMVQKAVEMGASRLVPVLTRHTQTSRVNLERMRANAVEAAEQCGILNVPEIADPMTLDALVAGWTPTRLLVFCDEDAETADPVAALSPARTGGLMGTLPVSLLVGPEGGFAEDERKAACGLPNVIRLALGPRILRADTAAVAALALIQAVLGDWR